MPNRPEQTNPRPQLMGRWRKVTDDEALDQYPAEIIFADDTYLGSRGPEQMMLWWDAGIYRMDDIKTLVLSTATDEMVSYDIEFRADQMTIEVPHLGAVVYERIKDSSPS